MSGSAIGIERAIPAESVEGVGKNTGYGPCGQQPSRLRIARALRLENPIHLIRQAEPFSLNVRWSRQLELSVGSFRFAPRADHLEAQGYLKR